VGFNGDFTVDASVYAPIGVKFGINVSEAGDFAAEATGQFLNALGSATEQYMGLPPGTLTSNVSSGAGTEAHPVASSSIRASPI
jgi:hypothetical protein